MITKLTLSHLIFIERLIISGPDLCKVKVKVTLKLEQAKKAQRGSRCIAILFPYLLR